MRRSTERILTTHCGRLPDPSSVAAFLEARASGDEGGADELLCDGVREMVREQAERGIDILGDGEFHKPFFLDPHYYASRWSGVTQVEVGPGEPTWFGARSPEMLDPRFKGFFEFIEQSGMFVDAGARRGWPASHRLNVAGPLEYRGQDPIRRELGLVRRALETAGVDHAETFYPQLAPGWIGHFLFNEHYPTAEEWWYALAEAWRGEYEAVAQAGFILQLDDPALADKYYMFNPPLSVEEYRRDAALRVEATNHALRNIPEDRIRYHVCWGSWHWRDVTLPEGKILIPGVVGHATSNVVESPELVAERLTRYAGIVGRENVIAGTDCGLGGRCHSDVAWAKLQGLAEGAALASERLWR